MDTAFSVKHYAGNVTYEIGGFVDRNKDTLFPDLIETMQSSTDPFIVALFPEDTSGSQNKRPTTAGFKVRAAWRVGGRATLTCARALTDQDVCGGSHDSVGALHAPLHSVRCDVSVLVTITCH